MPSSDFHTNDDAWPLWATPADARPAVWVKAAFHTKVSPIGTASVLHRPRHPRFQPPMRCRGETGRRLQETDRIVRQVSRQLGQLGQR